MTSADQRRKRSKRIIFRQSSFDSPLLSVRPLLLCFTFLSVLCLLSHSIRFTSSVFHPVLVVSTLSLLSSSSTSPSTTAKSSSLHASDAGNPQFLPKIEARVLFPDHVLLLLTGYRIDVASSVPDVDLECVYYSKDEFGGFSGNYSEKRVLSLDEYDEFRAFVRCPIPSVNYSADVINLRSSGENLILGKKKNQTATSWDNVVYDVALDKGTAVVFVKGLNLRPDRVSDPGLYTCHFGQRNGKYTVRTKALTVAQEVVRCSFPSSLLSSLENGQGIHVTVGVRNRVRARVLMPSVAMIFATSRMKERRVGEGKHELCACTMAWNQASAIREWIMYHSWLGVGRWFVYDNNSDDGTNEVVQELDRENHNVTRHVWPWIKTQEAGFSHCALRARDECNWVTFMDVDEYFYFPYSSPKHPHFRKSRHAGKNALRDLASNFSSTLVSEIRTTCYSFGPSGLTAPPPQGVTIGYTCRLQSPERHKSIVKPEALDTSLLNVVHHFRLKKGFKYVNLPQSTAVINHYKYQVWEVFRAKFHRRVATYVADWQQNQNEGSRDRVPGLGTEAVEPPDWPQKFCEVYDSGLRDFVLANLVDSWTGLLPWEVQLGVEES